MSDSETFSSYKQYLDDKLRMKMHGHVGVSKQLEMPKSAGSSGLKNAEEFMKSDVHLMGENKKSLRNTKNNPCWKGYKPVGTNQKNGKTVPNCVPEDRPSPAKPNPKYDYKLSMYETLRKIENKFLPKKTK